MNPITEHTSNPFLDKPLVKFIGLYKLTETTPSSLRDIPNYETIANAASVIDYSFPSYIASLHRCIREIQHAPIDPQADALKKTHRVRLSHPEFESHCQTLILPDFYTTSTNNINNDENGENNDTNSNNDDSDDENDQDGQNDDDNEQGDATKSRKKGTKEVSTQIPSKNTKNGQKGSKNDRTTSSNKSKPTKSTYLLFIVTDFNFVVEYSISSFFKDFTTQLNYISQKAQSMTIQQHDKKFFALLSQLYNRYLSKRKQTTQLVNTYHSNIKYQQELLQYQQQQNTQKEQATNTTTTTTTTSSTTTKSTPKPSIPEPTKPNDEIPIITLLTTIKSINYHNIHTMPRTLHIESVHSQPDYPKILECMSIPTNSDEMLQFAKELTFELQRIQMKDNVVQFLKGKTHFLGIPFSIWNYVVAGGIQILSMSAVFALLFYLQFLLGDGETPQ